jgi:hypothetical protein
MSRQGIDLNRSTLADWVGRAKPLSLSACRKLRRSVPHAVVETLAAAQSVDKPPQRLESKKWYENGTNVQNRGGNAHIAETAMAISI